MPKIIEELFAFVIVEPNGDEAVPAVLGPTGMWLPLMAADAARVDSLRVFAQRAATEFGRPVTLARFHLRHDVEVLTPETGRS